MDEEAMASRPRTLGEALREHVQVALGAGGVHDAVVIPRLVSEPGER
jgi:hypothetical protein